MTTAQIVADQLDMVVGLAQRAAKEIRACGSVRDQVSQDVNSAKIILVAAAKIVKELSK